MARTKHTMRRMRHLRGGEGPEAAPEAAPKVESIWETMSSTVGNFTKDEAPTAAAVAPTAEASGGKRGKRRHRGGSGYSHGVASYATAVGGRRRRCHTGGSHGVGVASYASPYTQGGRRRRRRTRRRHYKK